MNKVTIIAEAGINHLGDLQTAKNMAYSAKECGVDIVKFQTYKTEMRVSKDSPIFDILKRCELSFDQQKELKEYCDSINIEFCSTPFCREALRFLVEDLGLRKIKIASFDVTNRIFLDSVNEYGKKHPNFRVYLSTGMSNHEEVFNSILCLPDVPYLTLLHCVSAYPTPEDKVCLNTIKTLKEMVHGSRSVGYSDHTDGIIVPVAAVLVGATVIEKHFTLGFDKSYPDNPVSADPKNMKEMVGMIRLAEAMLGDGELKLRDIEKPAEIFRRKS